MTTLDQEFEGGAIQTLRPTGSLRGALFAVAKHCGAVVAFLALWEVLPRAGIVDITFLPPFSDVAAALGRLLLSGELVAHAGASAARALAGFAIAIAIGIPLGLAIGWYRRFGEILDPLIEIFRNTAPLALLPVFVLVLGLGEISKVALVVYSAIWPILLNTSSGVRNVDPLLIKSARSMALSSGRLFTRVILPASTPSVFTGIRLAGAYSILVLIAAEMVGAKAGLGYLVNYAQFNFQIPEMYAGIIALSAVGLLFNQVILHIERRVTAWKPAAAD